MMDLTNQANERIHTLSKELCSGKELEEYLKEEIVINQLALELLKRKTGIKKKKVVITEIHDYLKAHSHEVQNADKLANQFKVSKSYMMHSFKQQYGMTINNYLLRLRIEKAEHLLMTSELSVNEIASACGFKSDAYFTKVFHNEKHCSPIEYRKKTRKSITMTSNVDEPFRFNGKKNMNPTLIVKYKE